MHPTTLLLVLVLGPAPTNGVAQASACRPSAAISARFVQLVTRLATRTDALSVEQRTLLKIPQVKASQIVYVTDSRSCGKAFATYSAHTEQSDNRGATIQPSTQLYLVKE